MSGINLRAEVQVAKSESPDNSIEFPLRDQQYQKFSDNNQGNYSSNNIIFDLNSITNTQQFVSFIDSFIIIPVVQIVTFTGAANATNLFSFKGERSRLISCIKGSACSILNGLQLELNNEQVLSFTQGSNIPMEFTQISSYAADDFDLSFANDNQILESSDMSQSSCYYRDGAVQNIPNTANKGTPWYPVSSAATVAGSYFSTTTTTNAAYYRKLSRLASNARNDVITALFDPVNYSDLLNPTVAGSTLAASQLSNSRISYCDVTNSASAGSQSGEVGRFYYYLKLPLPLLHDFFKQAPLMKGISIRLTLYSHLPLTYTYSGNSIVTATGTSVPPTTASMSQPTGETLVNTSGYMPFTFSFPGPEATAVSTMSGSAPAAYTYTMSAGIQNITVSGTQYRSNMAACEFWAKLMTLSAPAEQAILQNPKKVIKFQDFQRVQQAQMVRIPALEQRTFNVHSGVRKPRGLLITTESYQLPGSTSIPFSSSALVHTAGVPSMPFMGLEYLQVRLGGKNIWNWNMEYGYDLFEREIRGLNSATGNMENTMRGGKQISFNNWLRQNGMIFIDLSKHIEQEDNSYFSIDMDIKNPYAIPLGLTCFIFFEKELSINVQTGQLFA